MAREIERKFLVQGDGWRGEARATRRILQAYLAESAEVSVRVRLIDGREGRLTLKSRAAGLARDEFEYAIPPEDALALIALRTSRLIEKERHMIERDGVIFEVDVFAGDHAGLVMAEVELAAEDQALPPLPAWVGREVTGDERYSNRALAEAPPPPSEGKD